MKIYLGSKSVRRKELLTQVEIPFELLITDTPEIQQPGESPEHYSARVTQEKLLASWEKITTEQLPPMPVLCADTEVIVDGKILGKPKDEEDAFNMLKSYSGRQHTVITTVGLQFHDYQLLQRDKTEVFFSELRDADIQHYLAMNTYQDKAGAYGIQSYIGQFICRIEGCFYSVMGLPLHTVRELLNRFVASQQ